VHVNTVNVNCDFKVLKSIWATFIKAHK